MNLLDESMHKLAEIPDLTNLVTLVKVSAYVAGIILTSNVFGTTEDDEGRELRGYVFVSSVVCLGFRLYRFHYRDNLGLLTGVLYAYLCGSLLWGVLTLTAFRLEHHSTYGKHPFYVQLANERTTHKETLFVLFTAIGALLSWIVKQTPAIAKENSVRPENRSCSVPKSNIGRSKKVGHVYNIGRTESLTNNIMCTEYWASESLESVRKMAFSPVDMGRVAYLGTPQRGSRSRILCRDLFPQLS